MAEKKKNLGRGLSALLDDNAANDREVVSLRLSQIERNPDQPRKDFDREALEQLAESIREHGVIQPLLVNDTGAGYVIIAGERRWRAARIAGLTEVPAIVCSYEARKADEIAMIENLQREDLNPAEEAMGYRFLTDRYGLTQEEVAERIGKPRSTVANALRLLELPADVLTLLRADRLSRGQAKILAGIEDPADAVALAKAAADGKMTVRELEKQIKKRSAPPPAPKAPPLRDSYYDEVEIALKNGSGRIVRVAAVPKNGKPGRLEIDFYDKEELAELAKKLGRD